MTLYEVIGSLKVHELRLKERDSREEEQALLFQALGKVKKDRTNHLVAMVAVEGEAVASKRTWKGVR